jgi:hypothetical protein
MNSFEGFVEKEIVVPPDSDMTAFPHEIHMNVQEERKDELSVAAAEIEPIPKTIEPEAVQLESRIIAELEPTAKEKKFKKEDEHATRKSNYKSPKELISPLSPMSKNNEARITSDKELHQSAVVSRTTNQKKRKLDTSDDRIAAMSNFLSYIENMNNTLDKAYDQVTSYATFTT